jgi:phospholipid N-methyltransferase
MSTHRTSLFIQRFFASPILIGTIAPTSASTARKMAAPIPSPDSSVLEIGAGDGSITQGIVERVKNHARITCVEIDPELAKAFKQNFPDITLYTEDAEDVLRRTPHVDAIVSGIPFSIMDAQKRARMFAEAARAIGPDGVFIPIQYALTLRGELKNYFDDVRIGFSFWNIPPTFFYICKKPKIVSKSVSQ